MSKNMPILRLLVPNKTFVGYGGAKIQEMV
jgi:hypothetical protein